MIRVGVKQVLGIPAPVLGELRHHIRARRQQPPQLLRAPRTAGEPAAHRHDRDGLSCGRLDLLQTLAGLVQVSCYPLEKITQPFFVTHLLHSIGKPPAC
jgi:hypothetical protein